MLGTSHSTAMHTTSGRCIWLSRRCESTALLGKVFADTLDNVLSSLLLVDKWPPVISPGSPTMSSLLHPEGPCVDTGQTTIKARSKFFYFTNIIVAGQKTTLLKVSSSAPPNLCAAMSLQRTLVLMHTSSVTQVVHCCSLRSTFLTNSVTQECILPSTVQAGAHQDSQRYNALLLTIHLDAHTASL